MIRKRFSGVRIIKMSLFGLLAVAGISMAVMWLWNLLIPGIFGLKAIGFWQAAGLFILTRIMTGGFRGGWHHGGHRSHFRDGQTLREKWMEMTEEERKEFVSRRRNFPCGPFYKGDIYGRQYDQPEKNETSPENK
jgi:ABC-type multidrug transport system fused ATPase/permease subunit